MIDPNDWDAETRRLAVSYAGPNFAARRSFRVDAFSTYSSESWSWAEFMAIMQAVPEEARDATTVELSLDYEGTSHLNISYPRDETDEEQQEHLASILAYCRNSQAQERATFERLKAKFGKTA